MKQKYYAPYVAVVIRSKMSDPKDFSEWEWVVVGEGRPGIDEEAGRFHLHVDVPLNPGEIITVATRVSARMLIGRSTNRENAFKLVKGD